MGRKQQGKRRSDGGLGGLFDSLIQKQGSLRDQTFRGFENAQKGLVGVHSSGGADEAFRAYMEHGKHGREILDYIKRVPEETREHIIQKIKVMCDAAQAGALSEDDMKVLKGWIESIRKIIDGLDRIIIEIVSGLPDLDAAPDMLRKIQESRNNFMKTLDFISQAVVLSEEVSDATEGRSGPESDTGVLGVGEKIKGSPGNS